MIRSFADKIKDKQKVFEAKQKILAEQAEQARLAEEEKIWESTQLSKQEKLNTILIEEEYRQEQEYNTWKQKQILLKEQSEQLPAEPIDTGIGIGHTDTWQLTWKSFSTHPDIINLPMSEKIRLYKIAERKQIDKLNYYANMYSNNQSSIKGSGLDWEDGVLDHDNTIQVDTIINSSLDVNGVLTIVSGITVTVNGLLTVNNIIINNGVLIVNGLVIKQENIVNNGTLIVN